MPRLKVNNYVFYREFKVSKEEIRYDDWRKGFFNKENLVRDIEEEFKINDNSYLELNLNFKIDERSGIETTNDFKNPISKSYGIHQIRRVLEKAKKDEKIKGMVLRIPNVNMGLSTIDNLRNCLKEFKNSGKFKEQHRFFDIFLILRRYSTLFDVIPELATSRACYLDTKLV